MKTENSGGICLYYQAEVTRPQTPNQVEPYNANCEDIIQALGLTFDEGCEFKSIWRRARARQGFVKAESSAVRDAQKAVHYAGRVLAFELSRAEPEIRIEWGGIPDWVGFILKSKSGSIVIWSESFEEGSKCVRPGAGGHVGLLAEKRNYKVIAERPHVSAS